MVFMIPDKENESKAFLISYSKAKRLLAIAKKLGADSKQLKTVKAATDALEAFFKLAAKAKHNEAKCIKACKKAKTALSTAKKLDLEGKTWGMEVARYELSLGKFPK